MGVKIGLVIFVAVAAAILAEYAQADLSYYSCPGANEQFTLCGSQCPVTCSTLNNPVQCGNRCVSGCYCRKGYYRRANNRTCVLAADCG